MYFILITFENENKEKVQFRVEVWSRPWLNPSLELVKIQDFT